MCARPSVDILHNGSQGETHSFHIWVMGGCAIKVMRGCEQIHLEFYVRCRASHLQFGAWRATDSLGAPLGVVASSIWVRLFRPLLRFDCAEFKWVFFPF